MVPGPPLFHSVVVSGNPQMIRDFSHAYCTILTFSHTLRPPSLSLDLFVSAMEMLTSALSPALESFPAYVTDTCSFMSLSTWSWPPCPVLTCCSRALVSTIELTDVAYLTVHFLWSRHRPLLSGVLTSSEISGKCCFWVTCGEDVKKHLCILQ